MAQIMTRLWRALGSIQLTLVLTFLLAADLGLGYLSLRGNLEIFAPMNTVGLLAWLNTYGAANPQHAIWFFAMMGLLGALAVNTFVCTTERAIEILAQRPPWRELLFRLAPHLMHYAVLIILGGYLCSYLFATSETGRALRKGEAIELAARRVTLRFIEFKPETIKGKRIDAFEGYVLRPNAQIAVREDGREYMARLNFNESIQIAGYGIYLDEFQPRRPGGGMGRSYIRLLIRRDPSAIIYRFGMAVFVLGLGLYVFGRKFKFKR